MTDTRYAAQAVTVEGYGDYEIVIQPIGGEPGHDWLTGEIVALAPLDGDFVQAADLDHALAGAGFTRVSEWEPRHFGSIATVSRKDVA